MISRARAGSKRLAGELGGALAVDAGVGEDEAQGRELAGMVGDDRPGEAHLAHQGGRVQRAGAAEGAEREVARVEAALDQHRAQGTDHVVVGDADDGEGRVGHAAAEASGDAGDGRVRGVGVEGHAAAEEVVGVEAAEDEIGVGDGGLGAALAVAGGAGCRAGTLRADAQHAALVDPGERAAAGADGADVDHRDLDRHAPFDLERGGERLPAADHGGDVGRGAAHVERDQMVDAGEPGDVAAGDHAAGRAGDQHLDRARRRRHPGSSRRRWSG